MRSLAFVREHATLGHLPEESRVVPLSPEVRLPFERQVADRPESLLGSDDFRRIDREGREFVEGWWRNKSQEFLKWRGVNLGECFENVFEVIIKDLLKAAAIVDRAIEQESPSSVFTDAPGAMTLFPR